MNERILMVRPVNPARPWESKTKGFMVYIKNNKHDIYDRFINLEEIRTCSGAEKLYQETIAIFDAIEFLENEAILRLQNIISVGKILAAKPETVRDIGFSNWIIGCCVKEYDASIVEHYFQPEEWQKDPGMPAIFSALECLQERAISITSYVYSRRQVLALRESAGA